MQAAGGRGMSKTRFIVKTIGEERQIFAVRSLGDGSIVFIYKPASTTYSGTGNKPVKDHHITVHKEQEHNIPKCVGNRIKTSLLTNEDEYFYDTIVIKKSKKNKFLWPLISIADAAIYGKTYEFSYKNGDSLVQVVGYPGTSETLIYTLFVCDPLIELPRVQGAGLITRTIGGFKVGLYTTFLHVSSGIASIILPGARGALRTGRPPSQPIGNAQDPAPFNPFTEPGITKYIKQSHLRLADEYLRYLKQSNGPLIPEKLRTPWESPTLGRWPAYNHEDYEWYGEESRMKNEIYSEPNFPDGTPKPPGWVDPLGIIRTVRR